MKEVLAQWALMEVIKAKLDRHMVLMAEAHSIALELRQAGVFLATVPSVGVALSDAAPRAPRLKDCRRCAKPFTVDHGNRNWVCPDCRERTRAENKRRFADRRKRKATFGHQRDEVTACIA